MGEKSTEIRYYSRERLLRSLVRQGGAPKLTPPAHILSPFPHMQSAFKTHIHTCIYT